ncbi:MAG: hypothetical protein CL946_06325 [Ectothiorhodospiraceae bacterium]|nr:hypothetical protein [Ectothiorhodospiraceae bacterium]
MGRVSDQDGDYIQQADISTITYTVYDIDDTTEAIVDETSLTVADVIFDALQVSDTRWNNSGDSTGYNFAAVLPGSAIPDDDVTYQIEVEFTPSSGEAFVRLWQVETVTRYGG